MFATTESNDTFIFAHEPIPTVIQGDNVYGGTGDDTMYWCEPGTQSWVPTDTIDPDAEPDFIGGVEEIPEWTPSDFADDPYATMEADTGVYDLA